MILYHTTLKKNLKSIKEKGLIASSIGIVYLSEKPDSWWRGKNYITFEVDLTGCKNELTTFNKPDLDEVLCWGDIESSRLKLVKEII